MKGKKLIALVVVGNLAGTLLTSYLTLNFVPSWPFATAVCRAAWPIFTFPLGWVGWIAGKFSTSSSVAYLLLGAGFLCNACLWGWVAAGILRPAPQHGTHPGFDVSAVWPRIADLRRDHALAAHSRSRQIYARKGLLAAASRAVKRCRYFSETERHEPGEKEATKYGH